MAPKRRYILPTGAGQSRSSSGVLTLPITGQRGVSPLVAACLSYSLLCSHFMPLLQSYDSEANGLVYHVLTDPRICRPGPASDIESEAESSTSGMTIQPEHVSDYFIQHHGRKQPASEHAARWFPLDNPKLHVLRHMLRKHMFGGNYIGPVKDILLSNPRADKRHNVLEIGTRSGTWIQEMATEFPHVQFRTWDIVPVVAHEPRPNIEFEVYDLTEGLLLEDNSQDIVFVNVGVEIVKDYRALLREVHRVLRPGGLLHIHEYMPKLWDSQDSSKSARRTNPIGCRLFDLVRAAVSQSGTDPDSCEKLPRWLPPDSGLWDNCSGGFEQIQTTVKICPSYPRKNHPTASGPTSQLAPLIEHLFAAYIRDSFSLLRDAGLTCDEASTLVEAATEEMRDPKKCALLKVYGIYATKRE